MELVPFVVGQRGPFVVGQRGRTVQVEGGIVPRTQWRSQPPHSSMPSPEEVCHAAVDVRRNEQFQRMCGRRPALAT